MVSSFFLLFFLAHAEMLNSANLTMAVANCGMMGSSVALILVRKIYHPTFGGGRVNCQTLGVGDGCH